MSRTAGLDVLNQGGMGIPRHDKIVATYDTTTNTYTYYLSGRQVAVVVVTYTDGTKTTLDTAERTA